MLPGSFLCILLSSNSMVSCEIWEKQALVSFSKTFKLCNFGVFEKLTRACFSQIALETILLPILIVMLG